MLEAQEEICLTKKWRYTKDNDAAHRMVTSHLGPVG